MEVYFDNSATTRIYDEVLELMINVQRDHYGNPSARHLKGGDAEKIVKTAKEQVANTLKVKPTEIFFTSGGTEGNNMAIIGRSYAITGKKGHIITTRIEHASVYNPVLFLESQGFEVSFLPVDNTGKADLNALKEMLRPDTVLVSMMMVNNEMGAIEPIEEAAKIVHENAKRALFHVDAIQAYGKLKILPKKMGIDILTVSGHKIHGPKGTGFIYIRENAGLKPIIYGGGQQNDMRSGTENVAGIAGLGLAAEISNKTLAERVEHMYEIREYMMGRLGEIEEAVINSTPGKAGAPQIISCSFEGVKAEPLLHALEDKGIYVSSGSACSSNHPAISGTLKAIGVRDDLLDCTIRFSFNQYNTKEEVDYCIEALKELIPTLKRYTRR
ncbi:MAG: cysteine desulfurase [Lachnospiraceae bacterium]|nr:cysteine desulfurase [Lachnospiraceae bacterium]